MPRPRFVPNTTVRFSLRPHAGPPRDALAYVAVRLAAPPEWVEPLLRQGRVTLDGHILTPGDRLPLHRPASLAIRLPEAWPPHLACVAMDLSILYEDAHLLALDKPPGRVVHPARGHLDNQTLANGVRHRYKDDIGKPGVTLGAPHRLDRDTSGVLVFARSTVAYQGLAAQFAGRAPHKEYWAWVDGRPDFDVTAVHAPLGVDPQRPQRGAVVPVHEGGKEAHTDVYVLHRVENRALVRAVPHTGRAHQIRLHLAHLGYPVRGDKDYNPRDREGVDGSGRPVRQALHAASLTITHPVTGAILCLRAPWPVDWPPEDAPPAPTWESIVSVVDGAGGGEGKNKSD